MRNMEENEGSENVDKNGMISKLGQNEKFCGKTLGVAARVYDNEFRCEDESVRICSSGFSNPRFDSQEGLEKLEIASHGIEETGVEVAHEFALGANREISKKCISLFVEVFGPPNGFTKEDEQVFGGNLENGRSSNHKEVEKQCSFEISQTEKEVNLGYEDKFLVGDVVWVRTTTNSWWPGQIIDPFYLSNVAYKPGQKASFLVKYIGKFPDVWCSPIWCSPKELKLFVENFQQMSLLAKSRVFPSAVVKAVDEFRRRIEAQMTCSCENRGIKERNCFLNKNVVVQFEPVNFLNLVKNLSLNDSKMGMLELVKIQSHLSAFYRSLGHHQLPMDQLHEKTDDDKHSAKRAKNLRLEDMIGSEKAFERNRKRSKYLSYPYMDLNQPFTNSDSFPKVKSTAKKVQKRKGLTPTYQPMPPIKPQDLDKPSVDLLSKLRLAVLDCFLPSEDSDFDSADRFFNRFRRWAFHNKYDLNGEKSTDVSKPITSDSNNVITLKWKRRKEEISTNLNANSAVTSSVYGVNGTSGSFVKKFEVPGIFGPENISKPKMKKERAKKFLERMQSEIEVALPDLNGKCTMQSPFVVNSQANNFTTPVNKQVPSNRKKKVAPRVETKSRFAEENVNFAETGSFLKTLQVNAVGLTNRERVNSVLMDDRLDGNTNKLKESSLVKDAWLTGFLGPHNNILGIKKRKRKEKTPKMEGQSTRIPDLNGTAISCETDYQAEVLPEIKCAPNEVKPLKKRIRRNKTSVPQADLDPCFSKVFMNGESTETALVLTFAEGFPVPSKEALITTFCGFGSLNETETKGLSDNKSAQIVFRNGSDAVEALKGIEKSCPFGPVLVKCRLHHISPFTRPIRLKPCELKATNSPKKSPVPRPVELKPCEFKATYSPKKEAPDLAYIRKNLEMMTSVLEKGGDNISADMRAKLENGVKGLLKKVSTMIGSTSSS